MVWQIDFVPARSTAARGIRPVRPIWMDVQNGNLYPVFNVKKGAGKNGKYTYPDDARNPYRGGPKRTNGWWTGPACSSSREATCIRGVFTRTCTCAGGASGSGRRESDAPRGRGNKAHLFRSVAKYFEPAGAVSWDVAMTGTRPDWRVKLRKGDVLSVNATYDTRRGAWWESMGIMVTYMADDGPGVNPFKKRVENRVPDPWAPAGKQEPRRRADGPARSAPAAGRPREPRHVDLLNFRYQLGDLSLGEPTAQPPPVIRPGQSLTFRDAGGTTRRGSTTRSPPASRPASAATGIAYPIADCNVQFESGTLGQREPTGDSARSEWATPLQPLARHLHVLLPYPPVYARGLPGQAVAVREGRAVPAPKPCRRSPVRSRPRASGARAVGGGSCGREGPRGAGGR